MQFSTRTTYGLRALNCLANHYGKGSLSLAHISKTEKISQKYLEIIFAALRKAKLVKSSKGALGGYELTKRPSQISIFEVVKALEKINVFYCINEKGKVLCSNSCNCGVSLVLVKVQKAIIQSLKKIKLSEL
ncbi:MAG: Rrf2 family transcriptional regulator [bacterium]